MGARDKMFQSEEKFVAWLGRRSRRRDDRVRVGIGDDAALVKVVPGQDLILTTDLSIEGRHFLRNLHPPRSVGHRALARALSDVAAMGGSPRFALVSIALSRPLSRAWIEEFYSGLLGLADRFGVAVVGGDTALVPAQATIDVVVAGEVSAGKALRRSGARAGDQLFVSGWLGLSAAGLRLLQARARRSRATVEAIRAHLYPEPKCDLGRFLVRARLASAAIDISDGFSTDLGRLCAASGVGACLRAELLPRPDPGLLGIDTLDMALHGGEDYQLLFTVPPHRAAEIPSLFRGVPLRRIGEIQKTRGLRLVGLDGKRRPLRPRGWDYFRRFAP